MSETYKNRSGKKLAQDQKRLHPHGTKKCARCPGEKSLSEFCRDKSRADGRNVICRRCQALDHVHRHKTLIERTPAEVKAAQIRLHGSDLASARKICIGPCRQNLQLSEFLSSRSQTDGLTQLCKNCTRAARKKPQNEVRQLRAQLKSVGCAKCKWNGPTCALDFAHREAANKRLNKHGKKVSPGALASANALLAESKKCDVLCANCHHLDTQNTWNTNISNNQKAIRRRKFLESRKAWVENEKKQRGECIDCHLLVAGFPTSLFDFDHKDPYQKILPISCMMAKGRYSRADIENEMQKCDLRCKRCHRIKTQERKEAKKTEADEKISEIVKPASPKDRTTFGKRRQPAGTNESSDGHVPVKRSHSPKTEPDEYILLVAQLKALE